VPHSPTTADTRRWWVVGTIGVALGVALAVWFGLSASLGEVTWQDTGYHVRGDRAVDVGYDVTRTTGRPVTCTIQALDVHHGAVGTVRVTIPASQESTTHRVTRVRTTNHAVTGQVQSCEYADAGS
jgi:uncharacterized protein DUF4307